MSILHQLEQISNPIYIDPAFLLVIENHIEWLRTHDRTMLVAIGNGDNDRAIGSLSRLLHLKKVPYDLHHIVARVNGFKTVTDYDGSLGQLYIPDASVIGQLISTHLTTYKMI